MPGPLIPKKSGVHRAACFALYRALLRQAPKLPMSQHRRDQYKNQVRSKTKENARLQGHWDTTIALRLGYETLDAIQDKVRRPTVLDRIAELSSPPPRQSRTINEKAPSDKAKLKRPPTAPPSTLQQRQPFLNSPVLDRPYPKISGRRRVPILVNANRVPILRFKKPQSPLIGALIRSAIRTRERRLARQRQIDEIIESCEDEDDWDQILRRRFGFMEEDSSWTDVYLDARDEMKRLYSEAVEKRKRIAHQMTIIMEKEKAFAQEERATLIQEKEARLLSKERITKSIGFKGQNDTEEINPTPTSTSETQRHDYMEPNYSKKIVSENAMYEPSVISNDRKTEKRNNIPRDDVSQSRQRVMWKPYSSFA